MAQDLPPNRPKNDVPEQETQDYQAELEAHDTLEDLGYHNLEDIGHSQEIILDE